MIMMLQLKENLKYLLKQRGMTVANLARLSKTPKQTLADWMAGAIPKDVRTLKRVAESLSLSIDVLCFGDVSMENALKDKTDNIFGDNWVEGIFEVRLRRIKKI